MSLSVQRTKDAVIIKTAPAKKVKVSEVVTQEQVWVNQIVELDQEIKASGILEKIARYEQLKKNLSGLAKESPPTEEAVIEGQAGTVVFSKAKNTVEVTDKEGLIEKLGQGVFNEVAKITITDLKQYLSENELACFTMPGYGSRVLKSITPKE